MCAKCVDDFVFMNGLKPDLSAEVVKADPQTMKDLRNVAERRRTTTPAVHESLNLALLNALQDMCEDKRKNHCTTLENIWIGQDTRPISTNNFLSVISNKISTTNMGLLCNTIDIRFDYNAIDTRVVALVHNSRNNRLKYNRHFNIFKDFT